MGVGRGLGVEVEVLGDERTSAPLSFRTLGGVSLFLLLCVVWSLWSV